VRPIPNGNYELVAGERRYRAASQIALAQVPVVIRELTDEAALQLALIENLQREDLNPLEETEGILQLLAFKLQQTTNEVVRTLYKLQNEAEGKVTHNVMRKNFLSLVEEVFNGLGLMSWESFVKNRLPLLNLPEEVLKALHQGQIAYTKAKAIAKIEAPQQRQKLLDEAIANNLSLNQIKERIKQLSQTPTATTVELTPQQRIKQTLTRLNQTRIWEDSRKKKKLERLLQQLEELMK
jgi:ParB family chromosome partitioning protein